MSTNKTPYYGFFQSTTSQTLAATVPLLSTVVNAVLTFDATIVESFQAVTNPSTNFVFTVPRSGYYKFDYNSAGFPSVTSNIPLTFKMQIATYTDPSNFNNKILKIGEFRTVATSFLFVQIRYCNSGERIRFNVDTGVQPVDSSGMYLSRNTLAIQELSLTAKHN